MMPFSVDFCARCVVSGSVLVRGAPFLGWIWCAVRRFWAGFWCPVCGAPISGPISAHSASFLGWILVRGAPLFGWILVRGLWCADFGADFGARCVVFGVDLVRGAPFFGLDFGARSVVRRFWADFGARCVVFGVDFGARCAVIGLAFGAWCIDVGVDHSQRATRSIKIGEDLGGIEPETFRIWGLGPGA